MSILAFDDVTYRYPGGPALHRVSFEIAEGELCLLAGLSGSGKSTLLRAACGLVPHSYGGAFAGRVIAAGFDTRRCGPAQIGAAVGMVFQDPEAQLVMGSVRSEIALPLQTRGASSRVVARGVEEVALALGIDRLLERSTTELSGGEKQRVALAAALVGRPRLVLLDEPTSQLDPVAGDELIGLLRRINQEWEMAIVLAEHRLERCLNAADRVIAMDGGTIVHDGDPRAFLEWASTHSPALHTPAAKLLKLVGVGPPPVGVRQARATLRAHALLPASEPPLAQPQSPKWPRPWPLPGRDKAKSHAPPPSRRRARSAAGEVVLDMRGVWYEIRRGPVILRGVQLAIERGESVVLMGRNGAGKSTLLRAAAGLLEPTRGKVQRQGRFALLLQTPSDYMLRDRVGSELSQQALRDAQLSHLAQRNPKDLSGGERQRLALAIVTDGGQAPAVLALDEPTRGMDRAGKAALADDLRERTEKGQAVIVATHDPEFAARCASRAVLLADGRVIADGPIEELLAGGWYFATETARVLGGWEGVLLPEQAAALLNRRAGAQEVPGQEIPPQEIPRQETPRRETPPQEMPPQEIPPQEIPPQEIPPQEIPRQEMPPREVAAQETPSHEIAAPKLASKPR